MTLLILGIAIFVAIHLLPTFVPVRQGLVQRLGEGPYKGVFSLVAFAGLILLVLGKARAPFIPVWEPPLWSRHAALAVMPFSLILLAASQLKTNVKRFTRHPMLWGVTLWAAAHLLANGDLASIVLFGGFGVFSLFAMWSANMRGAVKSDKRYPAGKDLLAVTIGLVAYVSLLFLHPYLFGTSPFA